MKCPKCGSNDLKVNEKRDLDAEISIRRRRECLKCGNRFTTYERIEIPSLLVVKKSGEKELFDRDKMASGIRKALEKRPFEEDKVEEIIDELEREINQHSEGEINSTEVGDMVVKKLKDIDHVAYLRFASVYKSFNDVESFEKELKELKVN
jgi:transcriptional repressor NrdR